MGHRTSERVPRGVEQGDVLDREGKASPLGERWRDRPALVVFLRHFACMACTEHIALLSPWIDEIASLGIGIVFVGNGAPNFIEGFVERNGLEGKPVEIVTDPSLRIFDAASLERSHWSNLSPAALRNFGRALLHGFRQTHIEGNAQQQGGVMLVRPDGRLAYVHRDRVAGDHAPTAEVVAAARTLA